MLRAHLLRKLTLAAYRVLVNTANWARAIRIAECSGPVITSIIKI
jgi:hypothetical protein